jgi:hypothetical protein
MKRKSILFFGVFAIATLLAATEVVAQCVAPDCMVAMGYQVKVIRDSNNLFPTYDGSGNATFTYEISKVNAKLPANYIDILIPNCVAPGASSPPYPNIDTSPTGYSLFLNGRGDLLTGFGLFDKSDYVLKWRVNYDCKNPAPLRFSMTIKNQKVGAIPTTMLLTAGAILSDSGLILGPDCNVLPARQSQVNVDTSFGTLTCTVSPDGTTFNCTSPTPDSATTVFPLDKVTIKVIDPNSGAYYEMHPYYISENSESIGTGSPCNYYTRLINNQLVVLAVGADCPKK